MPYEELESREYKVMLEPARFGNATSLPARASEFWDVLHQELPSSSALTSERRTWETSSPRRVTFWDTPQGSLYRNDFVLRCRSDDRDRRVTLKKRTPDRVLASHNGIDKSAAEDAGFDLRRKFEEDIKLTDGGRMCSLFSHSLDWRDPPRDVDLSNDIVERVFPGFGRTLGVDGDRLRPLGGLTMTEHVAELDDVEIGHTSAEVALIAWYRTGADLPSVVEFSYRYRGDERDFDPRVAADAQLILMTLAQLVAWRPPDDRRITKTSWFYREAGLAL